MEFAYVVRPAFDRAFLARATQEERQVLQEHGEWLQTLYADGRVVFAGRCYDGPFGWWCSMPGMRRRRGG
jgi:hypothetical protein